MKEPVFPLSEKEALKKGKKWSPLNNRYAQFPRRLKELRSEKSVSQLALAEKIGVTKSTISLYETGDNVPDAKTVVKLAEFFEVSTDYLLCQTDVKSSSIKMKEICKETGLSEASINNLTRIAKAVGGCKNDHLNWFLSLPGLWHFFFRISQFFDFNEEFAKNSLTFEQEAGNLSVDEISVANKKMLDLSDKTDLELFRIQNMIRDALMTGIEK